MRNAEGQIRFLDNDAYRNALVTGKQNIINYLSDPRYRAVVEHNQQLANRLGLNQKLPIQREMGNLSLHDARLAKINQPITVLDPRPLETKIIEGTNQGVQAQYSRNLDGSGFVNIPRVFNKEATLKNVEHEMLHHVYPNLGEGYPSFTPLEIKKAKSVFKDNAALRKIEEQGNIPLWYLDDADELVPNSFDLANDLGIQKFQKYPGMESFKKMLDSYTGSKPFIKDALKLDNKRDYKRAWDMLSGVRLGVVPAVGAAAVLQQKKKGGVINDDMGQWAHPGKVTRIKSPYITMQGVPYPVLGVSDTGDTQMMYPGEDYEYDGNSVTEFPMMQKGGLIKYQTAGPVTYTHEPGKRGAYRLQRTVTPYTRNRDIKRFTQAPTDPREVNFLQNYAGAISGYQDDPGFKYPTQVPYEGAKHWNIDRFIIDPQFSTRTGALQTEKSTLEQNRANTLADMYKYYMLQDPEHKGRAFRKAKRFVRREVDPRIKGSFLQSYNSVTTDNPDYFQKGYQGMDRYADQNSLKDLYFREATGEEKVTPEEIKRLKDVSMDYFRNYKKMSRRDAKDQWNKWNQEATTAKETGTYYSLGGLTKAQGGYTVPPINNRAVSDNTRVVNPSMTNQGVLTSEISDVNNFNKGWINSPMYNQMLTNSIAGSTTPTDKDIPELRELTSDPSRIQIVQKDLKDPSLGGTTEYIDYTRTGPLSKVTLNTNTTLPRQDVLAHEILGHATDLGGALIPSKDKQKINKYFTGREKIDTSGTDPIQIYAEQNKISYAQAKQQINENLKDPQWAKGWNDYTGKMKELVSQANATNNQIEDSDKYISRDSETRARMMKVRKLAKGKKIYDPFTQKMTRDNLKKLKSLNDFELNSLFENYTEDELLDMFNTISMNDQSQSQNMARYGGLAKAQNGLEYMDLGRTGSTNKEVLKSCGRAGYDAACNAEAARELRKLAKEKGPKQLTEWEDITRLDKEDKKALKEQFKLIKDKYPGIDFNMLVAANRDASRTNVQFGQPERYGKYFDPETGEFLRNTDTRNVDDYMRFYRKQFPKQTKISATDVLDVYNKMPGGLSNYERYVNEGYFPYNQTVPNQRYGGLIKAQGGYNMQKKYPIDLRLSQFRSPGSFFTGYGSSENPVPNVNVHNIGAYGEGNVNNRMRLSGNVNSASVFYPGGNRMFMNPSFNVGMKYRFQGGGDISIPNLRQAYYPMAYGGPMVRYMAGKMTGPNIF
jgi:hypothetical protein